MFEKLKNFKFSRKKKGKEEGATDEDIFSSSEDDNFFSEPSFGDEDTSSDEGLFSDTGDAGESLEEVADLPEEKSSEKKKKKKKKKSKPAGKEGGSRRTLLLFLLLLIFSSYGAYTYIIPGNYPELKKEIDSQIEVLMGQAEGLIGQATQLISGEEAPPKTEAPKRIAIKKPATKAAPKPPVEVTKAKPEAVKKEVQKPAIKVEAKAADAKPAEPVKTETAAKKKELPKKAPATAKKEVEKPAPAPRPQEVPRPKTTIKKKAPRGKIKVVRAQLPVSDRGYYVQAGAFIFKDNLNKPRRKIESLGLKPKVKTGSKLIGMNRLLVGEWGDFLVAEDIAAKLRRKGFKAELTSKNEQFCVLIGSYYYKDKALRTKRALKAKGFDARIERKRIKMKINYLLLGPYNSPEKAAETTDTLDRAGVKTVIIQKK